VPESGSAGMPTGGSVNTAGSDSAAGASIGGSTSGGSNLGGSPAGGDGGTDGDSTTCTLNGVTYPVGAPIGLCLCLPDGTVGHCTGSL
jgi:hypothetical protein